MNELYPHPSRVTVTGPDNVTGLLPKCEEYACVLAAGHDGDHLEQPYRQFYANAGRLMVSTDDGEQEVTDDAGAGLYGRARERFEEAAAQAEAQRVAIAKAEKTAAGMNPRLVRPAGSHSVTLERAGGGTIEKEELYPIVELEAPRAGTVRAQFSVDRSTHSDANDGRVMGPWRIILRDVRTAGDDSSPPYGGPVASGIGPATRQAIDTAGEPLIREWLETDDYAASRRRAVAYAVRRGIAETGTSTHSHAYERRRLEQARPELEPDDADRLARALELLEEAGALLDATPAPHDA